MHTQPSRPVQRIFIKVLAMCRGLCYGLYVSKKEARGKATEMDLVEAKGRALQMLSEHGLHDWTHEWDRAKRRFGSCNYTYQIITQSSVLVHLNGEHRFEQNMLHEIAHALAGPGTGHGPKWKRIAREIGFTGERCYDAETTVTPKPPYLLICETCGQNSPRHRRSNKAYACGKCCKKYNGGRFSAQYQMVFVKNF